MPKPPARVLIVLALAVAGAVAGPVAAAPAAGGGTVTACVNKRTGDARIVTGKKAKKKCPKGTTKVTWNASGRPGPTGAPGAGGANGLPGAPGPVLMVKDKNGAVVGQFVGLIPEGFSLYLVLRDGGAYVYIENGQIYPLGESPSFKTNTCNGTAYMKSSSAAQTSVLLSLVGGSTRFVYRATNPVFGPTSAWKLAGPSELVNMQLYKLNDSGACVADGGAYNGTLVTLASVTAPPDVPGLLTIG